MKCTSHTGVRVDHEHATNDFCIAPRLAEFGAHSMDSLITMDGLMKEPSAQLQHATNDFCIAPRLAESGAHSMDGLMTMDGLMKEPCAQVKHATNDFCIAPRLAESGADRMAKVESSPRRWEGARAWVCLPSRHFGIFNGSKFVTTGSKCAKSACLSPTYDPGPPLEKRVFDPFWTHFWSQNGPRSRHFGIFHGPKRVTTGSKWAKNTCLSIPSGLGTTLEKIFFFALGTLVDPPLAPTVRGLAGPLAAPSDHWYGGLRVSLGNSEGWKPQKVGDCGWTRCPRNSVLSHVAQETARSWFRCVGAHCAVFGAFWRLFGPFLGHIVELQGTKGPLVTGKSSRTCSVAAVCLRLAVLKSY